MTKKNSSHEFSQSVYIPTSSQREKTYLQKHQIHLNRLKNGATIAGIHRLANDRARANITISFPTGSYFDPPGKEGTHHFFEHFFNKKVRNFASPLDVSVNATTSPTELNEYISGPASHRVSDFGVWPIVSLARSALISPLTGLKNLDQLIEQEKKVITSEINEHMASHDFLVKKYLRQTVFASNNPLLSYPPGTKDSLASITKKDLEKLAEEVLIPDGMLVNFISEGDKRIYERMIKHLENLFTNFPRADKKAPEIDWALMDGINTHFTKHAVYQKPTGLNNNLVTALFIWVFKARLFTPSAHALWRLIPILHNNLFILFRQQGWGYSVQATLNIPGDETAILVLQLDIPAQKRLGKKIEKLLSPIKRHVFSSISDKQIEQIYRLERKRQMATPIASEARLKWMMKGLREKGKLIDADAVKAVYNQITPSYFKTWLTKLQTEKPAILLVGDL